MIICTIYRASCVYKDGYTIISIDSEEGFIEFANGEVVQLGQAQGGLHDAVQKAMIRATIERHLEKEKRFIKAGLGIKVLSVFFHRPCGELSRLWWDGSVIVAGKFAMWFEEALADLLKSPRFSGLYDGFELDQFYAWWLFFIR